MNKYWLAVMGNIIDIDNLNNEAWWCLPGKASKGDSVLMYCPRSTSVSRQGIFAECKVMLEPNTNVEGNWRCAGYGQKEGQIARLGYTELALTRRFEVPLIAKDLKRDPVLRNLGFVRRNFQGTTFELPKEAYDLIIVLSSRKAKAQTATRI